MPSVVGLDFVGERLHVAALDGVAGSAVIRTAFSAPLPLALKPENAAELGRWLKDQLAQNRLASAEAAASLGRGHVSFRTLQVPDCPPEELPSLVRLTLEGDAGVDEDQVVDFDAGPVEQGQRSVTAAYASAKTVEAVREMIKAAGLVAKRLVLRPYAMRFLRDQMLGGGDGGTELLLIPSTEGLDLSIWSGKRLEMARSVSAATSAEGGAKLSAELRRTLAAYQNNHPGASLKSVAALSGDADAYAPSVQNALQRTVSSADPSKKLRNLPENKATWGAVATAWQAAAASPPTLNLFQPRKPPPPTYSTRRIGLLAGLFLLVAVGTIYFWRDARIRSLEREISAVETDMVALKEEVAKNQPLEKKHAEAKKWVNSRVDWLEQLNDLAALTPPTDQAFLTALRGESGARNDLEAKLKLDFRMKDALVVRGKMNELHSELRYSVHSMGTNSNTDFTDFTQQEPFDVHFYPKGVKPEASAKGASGKQATTASPPTKSIAGKEKETKKLVYADSVPSGMKRIHAGLGTKKGPTAAARASATSAPVSIGSTPPRTPSAGEKSSDDALAEKVNRLVKLPLDEYEREIAKEKSLLQRQLRKRVDEARAKAK